ncbi:MAG: amidohydrolase, partial [Lachnospiraceae bacterium]|nr:amidohydrolase [Lachnospiraceae bacterium]
MYIIGGLIKTMAGEDIEDGYLRVGDGKITEIGKRDEMSFHPAPHEQIIEVREGLIMPGIIEAHCHMGITEEKKGMEGDDCNETVNPITPYLRSIDAVNTMDAAFDDAVRAGITSAMIGPGSSNVVGGQFAFLKTRGRRVDDLIVKAPAAMKVAFGENPKVNYSGEGKSPSTRMAIAAMLREELFRAQTYSRKKKKALAAGEDFEEDFAQECWLPVLDREIPLKAHV